MKKKIVEKPKPSSLPDLFSLINDENFGITESEDTIENESPRESKILEQSPKKKEIFDSHRLELSESEIPQQPVENEAFKIKKELFGFMKMENLKVLNLKFSKI